MRRQKGFVSVVAGLCAAIPSHLMALLVVHHLAEVIFQWVLGKIRQSLVHGVMLLWRGGDADTTGRGVVLIQILKVYTAAETN